MPAVVMVVSVVSRYGGEGGASVWWCRWYLYKLRWGCTYLEGVPRVAPLACIPGASISTSTPPSSPQPAHRLPPPPPPHCHPPPLPLPPSPPMPHSHHYPLYSNHHQTDLQHVVNTSAITTTTHQHLYGPSQHLHPTLTHHLAKPSHVTHASVSLIGR